MIKNEIIKNTNIAYSNKVVLCVYKDTDGDTYFLTVYCDGTSTFISPYMRYTAWEDLVLKSMWEAYFDTMQKIA